MTGKRTMERGNQPRDRGSRVLGLSLTARAHGIKQSKAKIFLIRSPPTPKSEHSYWLVLVG